MVLLVPVSQKQDLHPTEYVAFFWYLSTACSRNAPFKASLMILARSLKTESSEGAAATTQLHKAALL